MTLRLILVSTVAALGLTIPSRTECKRFLSSAEMRASSYLAGWDTWRPGDGAGHRKSGATATRECELCRLARAQVALRAQNPVAEVAVDSTATARVSSNVSEEHVSKVQTAVPARAVGETVIAFEPIDVEDEISGGLAFDLNRAAEGIDLVEKGTPSESSRVSANPETSREIGNNLDWIDKLCGRLVREVRSAAITAQPSGEAVRVTAEALAATAIREQREQPTAIAGTHVRSEILPDDATTSVEWSSGYGPDLFAAIENRLAQLDVNNPPAAAHEAACLPFVSQSTQSEISAPIAIIAAQDDGQQEDAASSQIPWPVFAPEKSVPQPATRIAEEIQVPWPVFAPAEQAADQAIARESSMPETRWGQAVHLTRAAVVAWMKVLAGPALVEVSAR
jgi:hypothetical protein